MVIADHGSEQHARVGVERVDPDVVAAREQLPDLLVFQGLEWNIPAAEHRTVFVHPAATRSRCRRSSRTPTTPFVTRVER